MLKKLRAFIMHHYGLFAYLFFGVLTTVVNYLVYLPFYLWLGIPSSVSNIISWTVAVAFAFLTNKPFVFKSNDWSKEVVLPELSRFVVCRAGSGLIETLILFTLVDCLKWDGVWTKLIVSGAIVILNYVGSKLLVFKNRKG